MGLKATKFYPLGLQNALKYCKSDAESRKIETFLNHAVTLLLF